MIRILHVVGGMNQGGVETWLMHVLRNIDRKDLQMDFLVETTEPCAYDEEVLAKGSKIIPCLHPSKPFSYARNFKRLYRQYGPYNVIHCHIHHYSGFVLRLAHEMGVPVRIVHSHTDTSMMQVNASFLRRSYLGLMQHWILRYATLGLAVSEKAAFSLFGSSAKSDLRWQIFHCGINLTSFKVTLDSLSIRSELGIPPDRFVIGHVGRFVEAKNHSFIVDILEQTVKREPKACLLLVGDGPLRLDIEQKLITAGLSEHVVFTGMRSDVPRIMLSAMDVFLFPSLYEGLGLVLVEAQASGLPCIVSDVIPQEAEIVKSLVQRVSLSQISSEWAKSILAVKNLKSKVTQQDAMNLLEQSLFNINLNVKALETIYLSKIHLC